MDARSLPQVIAHTRARYHAAGLSDHVIGNGYCENFAHEVLEAWAGPDWVRSEWVQGAWGSVGTECLCDGNGWLWGNLEQRYGIRNLPVDRAAWDRVATLGPNHVWIEATGLCFDCEHPEGVNTPFDLNFFRRYMELRPESPEPF